MAAVTIVVGPPASGKTTWVQKQAREGDLIVDVDALFVAVSGLEWYHNPAPLLPFVVAARDALIGRLAEPSEVRAAWVITTNTDRRALERMRETLGARLEVMEVSPGECKRRIAADARRENREAWFKLIDQWFARWSGRAGHEYRSTEA